MKKVIVLDFQTAEVHIFSVPNDVETEEFLWEQCSQDGLTFKPDSCEWMELDLSETEGRVPIYIH